MREIKDNEGRPWLVALTCASAARVKDMGAIEATEELEQPDRTTKTERRLVPFDIINTATVHKTLEVLRMNYGAIAETVHAIVLRQVEEKGLTREQFLDGFKGDALEAAARAIEEELIDFFPQRLRQVVRLMASKMDEVLTSKTAEAKASIEAAEVTTTSGTASGRPPESWASTPESGLSGSSSPLATPA